VAVSTRDTDSVPRAAVSRSAYS